MIESTTAAGWSVFGALMAYLIILVLPELIKQHHRERKTGIPYRPVRLTWILGILLFACAAGAGVGAAEVLDPCSRGDAWVCGLGSISLVAGILNLGSLAVPRP